jgi:hypothetical protein
VTRIRVSKLSRATALSSSRAAVRGTTLFRLTPLFCLLCCRAGGVAVEAPTITDSREPRPRQPDAVVLEPPAAMPGIATHAQARGVVALREPAGGDAVGVLVMSLVAGWQRESLDALSALLTADAGPFGARGRGRAALVEGWRQRLRAHQYADLAGIELVRPERIERWDFDDLGALAAPARPPEMRPGELYVRAPLETTQIGGQKLFDDVIVMLLRREDGEYKIAAYGEVAAP